MSTVALLGDATTTSALAITSAWPDADALLVEMDPSGGSVAAWLGVPATPSLSSLVAAAARGADDTSASPSAPRMDELIRLLPGGLRFVPCPISRREARSAVTEAAQRVIPLLAATGQDVVMLDLGRAALEDMGIDAASALGATADVAVAVHRQEQASVQAAAVRLERFADGVRLLAARRAGIGAAPPLILVVGDRPFDPDEIRSHVGPDDIGDLLTLAEDPLSAAVLAGRAGVSERRLRRQPLLRDARTVGAALVRVAATVVTSSVDGSSPEVPR